MIKYRFFNFWSLLILFATSGICHKLRHVAADAIGPLSEASLAYSAEEKEGAIELGNGKVLEADHAVPPDSPFEYGGYSLENLRNYPNEDVMLLVEKVLKPAGRFTLIAIFDGHGADGRHVARKAQEVIKERFESSLQWFVDGIPYLLMDLVASAQAALSKVNDSGTTVTMVILKMPADITASPDEPILGWSANLGDSRGGLSSFSNEPNVETTQLLTEEQNMSEPSQKTWLEERLLKKAYVPTGFIDHSGEKPFAEYGFIDTGSSRNPTFISVNSMQTIMSLPYDERNTVTSIVPILMQNRPSLCYFVPQDDYLKVTVVHPQNPTERKSRAIQLLGSLGDKDFKAILRGRIEPSKDVRKFKLEKSAAAENSRTYVVIGSDGFWNSAVTGGNRSHLESISSALKTFDNERTRFLEAPASSSEVVNEKVKRQADSNPFWRKARWVKTGFNLLTRHRCDDDITVLVLRLGGYKITEFEGTLQPT